MHSLIEFIVILNRIKLCDANYGQPLFASHNFDAISDCYEFY